MAVVKEITIKVNDGDLDQLDNDLKKVGKSFDNVESEAKKASGSLKDVGDNGGAIALLDELTGGLATKIRDAAEASKLFNFSLKGTRTALIATGIGAFVVALGTIVSYWDEIVEFITQANARLEEQRVLLEANSDILDSEIALNKARLDLSRKQGKNVQELVKREKQLVEQKKANLEAQLLILESQLATERSKVQEVTLWEKIKITALSTAGLYERAAEASANAVAGDEEQRQNLLQRQNDILKLREQIVKLDTELQFGLSGGSSGDPLQERDFRVAGELNPNELAEIENAKILSDMKVQILADQISREEALEKTKILFKRDILSQEADLVMQFGGILQQLGEENKALAVAGIIADQIGSTAKIILATQEANAKAVAASPLTLGQPWVTLNTVSAGLGIASGVLAASKAISALGGSGGGSLGSSNVGGNGQSAPSFNVVGTSGVNQLAESLNQEQQPIEAYVVANNVTSAQSLNNNIIETATLG